MRADLLDEEAVRLYKEAGGRNICLGVESSHPGGMGSATIICFRPPYFP